MIRILFTNILIWGLFSPAAAQPEAAVFGWKVLEDVTFTKTYDAENGLEIITADFGEGPRQFEGQIVEIRGFVIPIRLSEGLYFLSRYPNDACFFCGAAGPETVIELRTKRLPSGKVRFFAMDDELTFRGKLLLNADDFKYTSYILEEAEPVD